VVGQPLIGLRQRGGTDSLDLSPMRGPRRARWFNPRSGRFSPAVEAVDYARSVYAAPDTQDWALLIDKP
jgi:hypothetical protein